MRIDNFDKDFKEDQKSWTVINVNHRRVYWWNFLRGKFMYVCQADEQPQIYIDGFFEMKEEAQKQLNKLKQ